MEGPLVLVQSLMMSKSLTSVTLAQLELKSRSSELISGSAF